MKPAMVALALCLCGTPALAQESGSESEQHAAEPAANATATEAARSATQATAAVSGKDDKEPFKLPPGFYKKKFGKHQLYCKKYAPMGTRIRTEQCMNDLQMREYLLALQEQKSEIDRIRATCATASVCASP